MIFSAVSAFWYAWSKLQISGEISCLYMNKSIIKGCIWTRENQGQHIETGTYDLVSTLPLSWRYSNFRQRLNADFPHAAVFSPTETHKKEFKALPKMRKQGTASTIWFFTLELCHSCVEVGKFRLKKVLKKEHDWSEGKYWYMCNNVKVKVYIQNHGCYLCHQLGLTSRQKRAWCWEKL